MSNSLPWNILNAKYDIGLLASIVDNKITLRRM